MIDPNDDGDYNNHNSIPHKFNVFDVPDVNTINLNKLLKCYIVHLRNDRTKTM